MPSEEQWHPPGQGVHGLTLDEQLALERTRRANAKEVAAEGPGLGFNLEREADPRESDKWFTGLDETTQTVVKGEWRLQNWLTDAVWLAYQDRRRQAYIDAGIIYLLSQTLFDPFRISFLKVLGILPIALLVGWLWGRFKMGRTQSIVVGYPILLTYQLMTGLGIHGSNGMLDLLTLFYGGLAFCSLTGMAGLMRESAT